ncbi:MAG TPA: polysaccharide deacetylase family protein [Planctomycetota bacterium]|nr:polysaccharide deacetylase family protein [Planctomycetota bacterium]
MMSSICFNLFPGGRKKALTMSYDDGVIHDRRLVEIFNRYGIRGTFHLNSGKLRAPGYISASDVRELYAGHEVSVHTVTHPYLGDLPRELIVEEIVSDRKALEKLAGYPVRGMSYPFGTWDDRVLELLPACGIEYARTTESHRGFHIPRDFLTWGATCHHKFDLLDLVRQFAAPSHWFRLPLFYVWGHSYEFENDKNWGLIEEFCKVVSGDDSTWYATNIEIVDYVQAIRRVQSSADGTMLRNPSAISVWLTADGQPREIKPGEILTI